MIVRCMCECCWFCLELCRNWHLFAFAWWRFLKAQWTTPLRPAVLEPQLHQLEPLALTHLPPAFTQPVPPVSCIWQKKKVFLVCGRVLFSEYVHQTTYNAAHSTTPRCSPCFAPHIYFSLPLHSFPLQRFPLLKLSSFLLALYWASCWCRVLHGTHRSEERRGSVRMYFALFCDLLFASLMLFPFVPGLRPSLVLTVPSANTNCSSFQCRYVSPTPYNSSNNTTRNNSIKNSTAAKPNTTQSPHNVRKALPPL